MAIDSMAFASLSLTGSTAQRAAFVFDSRQRTPFRFEPRGLHPNELQNHHKAEESKDGTRFKPVHHRKKERRQQCRKISKCAIAIAHATKAFESPLASN
jgi:hypothetical protein